MRLRRLVAFAALAVTFSLAGVFPANASRPDPANYPLRVHVYSTRWGRDYLLTYYDSIGYGYHGYGRANLTDGSKTNAMDYTFDCEEHFLKSDSGEDYIARWKKPGKEIEMLVGIIGTDKVHTCRLHVTVKDYVYHRVRGTLETLTQEQYAQRESNEAARSASLAPEDADATHYPVKLSLLDVKWDPRYGGMYSGLGHGNVQTAGGPRAADIALSCPVTIGTTPEGRFYQGKWTVENEQMNILLHKIGDQTAAATCSLKTAMHEDVYVIDGGVLKAVSPARYKALHPPEEAEVAPASK